MYACCMCIVGSIYVCCIVLYGVRAFLFPLGRLIGFIYDSVWGLMPHLFGL